MHYALSTQRSIITKPWKSVGAWHSTQEEKYCASKHLYSRSSFCVSFLSRVDELNKLVCLQCMGLHSSAGRALQRKRRGHGFESVSFRHSHDHSLRFTDHRLLNVKLNDFCLLYRGSFSSETARNGEKRETKGKLKKLGARAGRWEAPGVLSFCLLPSSRALYSPLSILQPTRKTKKTSSEERGTT